MAMTLQQRQSLTQNEVGAANAAITRLGQALQRAGESIDRRVGDMRAQISASRHRRRVTASTPRSAGFAWPRNWPRRDDEFLGRRNAWPRSTSG